MDLDLLQYILKSFIAFYIYSIIGWAYESFVWAPCEKKEFINRGFLLGPICPIYGIVCAMDYFLLKSITHPLAIFCTAMVVCCCCEYLISYTFEKIFHARWWDYSNYAFNLNGRISLYSAILFGLGGLLLMKVVHPLSLDLLSRLSPFVLEIVAASLLAGLITDLTVSLISMKRLNRKIKIYYRILNHQLDKPFDYLNDHLDGLNESLIAKKGNQLILKFENFNEKMIDSEEKIKEKQEEIREKQKAFRQKYFSFGRNELHFLRAFPDYRPKFSKNAVDEEKERTLSKVFETIRSGFRKKIR